MDSDSYMTVTCAREVPDVTDLKARTTPLEGRTTASEAKAV
jgi:hypothetical protein